MQERPEARANRQPPTAHPPVVARGSVAIHHHVPGAFTMSGRKSKSVAARLAGHLLRMSAPKAASLSLAALCAVPGVLAAQSTIILQGHVSASGDVPIEGARVTV